MGLSLKEIRVTFRLAELDRQYHRRIAVTYPLSAVLVLLILVLLPADVLIDRGKTVGLSGPLRILPEIDIVPDRRDERHLTAAPNAAPPVDFVVVELDFAAAPLAEPVPVPTPPPPKEVQKHATPEFSDFDNVMTAVRTTGFPILAQTDYELIYMQRPIYPSEAIRRGIEGEVEIMLLVGKTGRVERVHILHPNRLPLLEKAASEAVNKSLFRAHLVDGKPTAFWIKVPIEFRLIN
jgi:TonB family protein